MDKDSELIALACTLKADLFVDCFGAAAETFVDAKDADWVKENILIIVIVFWERFGVCSNAKSEAFGVARRAFGKGLPFARGYVRGAHVWTKKKILINSKKRSQNTHKRVGLYST